MMLGLLILTFPGDTTRHFGSRQLLGFSAPDTHPLRP